AGTAMEASGPLLGNRAGCRVGRIPRRSDSGCRRHPSGQHSWSILPRNSHVTGLLPTQNADYILSFRCASCRSMAAVKRKSNGEVEFHSPQREAAMFYGLFLRGHSADALRQEIDIAPTTFRKWMRSREFDKAFRENLRRMYAYRKQVLAIFDSLVTSEKAM